MPEVDEAELKTLRAAAAALAKTERERDAFREQATAATAALTAAKAAHATEVEAVRTAATRGAVLDKAGIADPKVRGWFEAEYAEAAQAAGDKAPAFDAWIGGLTAETAPHLAPWLPKSATGGGSGSGTAGAAGSGAGAGATGSTTAKTGSTTVAGSGPAAAPVFTAESIAQMTAAEFRANLPAIQAAHPNIVDAGFIAAYAKKEG